MDVVDSEAKVNQVVVDAGVVHTLPAGADFLMCYSVAEGETAGPSAFLFQRLLWFLLLKWLVEEKWSEVTHATLILKGALCNFYSHLVVKLDFAFK